MPIYEYRCDACGHELEKIQRISDEPLTDCPECGKPRLRRLVSAAGFRLKGGGWYETDFKKGGKRNLHDSGAVSPSSKPEAPKSDTTKSESTKSESTKSSSGASDKSAGSGSA